MRISLIFTGTMLFVICAPAFAANPLSFSAAIGTTYAESAQDNAQSDGQTLANNLNGSAQENSDSQAFTGFASFNVALDRRFSVDTGGFITGPYRLTGTGSGSGYSSTFSASDRVSGVTVLLTYRYPIADAFSVYAGAGGAYTTDRESWTATTTGNGIIYSPSGSIAVHHSSVAFAAGLTQQITRRLAVNVDFLRINAVGGNGEWTQGPFDSFLAGVTWRL